jgi:hypothetical protein
MSVRPEFQSSKLLITDFDGTYAMTDEPSPKNMTVSRAYELAINELFNSDGLEKYKAEGGLRNRGPAEVITQLAPNLDTPAHGQKTEELVQLKLGHLLAEVGQRLPDGTLWPRLAPGFRSLWSALAECEQVDTGVATSGHRPFVERFHEVHELSLPDLMITDDDMRPLMERLPKAECVKPSGLILELLHQKWLGGYSNSEYTSEPLAHSKNRMLYMGNDPVKDGQMAENYGIEFVLIDESAPDLGWANTNDFILLAHE